jgi:hypothetical protein
MVVISEHHLFTLQEQHCLAATANVDPPLPSSSSSLGKSGSLSFKKFKRMFKTGAKNAK